MIYRFQRRHALVGLVLLTGVSGQISHVPHVAVARLQIQGIVQLVGQTDASHRRHAGIRHAKAVGVRPVGTRFTKQGKILPQRQTGDTGQGGTLIFVGVVVDATVGIAPASVLVTQFGTERFVEVVTHEEVAGEGVFGSTLHAFYLVQAIEVSGTDTGTEVDVVTCVSNRASQCQCNPYRCQS
ncbi:hypothetical protein D3C75_752910 [compost metagenome]